MSLNGFDFPLESRLTEKSGFSNVFANKIYAKRTEPFSVFAAKSNKPRARLGIVVAKRNIKLAAARNKMKRLIREAFRLQQQQLSGLDIVVVVNKKFDRISFASVGLR